MKVGGANIYVYTSYGKVAEGPRDAVAFYELLQRVC